MMQDRRRAHEQWFTMAESSHMYFISSFLQFFKDSMLISHQNGLQYVFCKLFGHQDIFIVPEDVVKQAVMQQKPFL